MMEISSKAKGVTAFHSQIRTLRAHFTQSGAVFHLLQMSPGVRKEIRSDITANYSALNMEPVFSNWDAVFQSISKASGGPIVDLDKGIGSWTGWRSWKTSRTP
jgi:hypothetical protein